MFVNMKWQPFSLYHTKFFIHFFLFNKYNQLKLISYKKYYSYWNFVVSLIRLHWIEQLNELIQWAYDRLFLMTMILESTQQFYSARRFLNSKKLSYYVLFLPDGHHYPYQSASFLRRSLQLSGGDTVFLRHTTDSFVKSSHVVLFHGFLHLSNYFLFMLLFLSAMNPFVGCLCFLVCSNGYRTPTSEMIQTKMLPPIRYVPENKLNQNVFSVNLQGGWMASFLIHN